MGAFAKVLVLAAVLATAVGATLWLVREPDAAPSEAPAAPTAPSTRVASTPTRPVRAPRGTKAAKPAAVEEDSLATTDAHGVAKFDRTPMEDAWLFAYEKGRGRARGEIPDRRDPAVPLVLTLTSRTIRVAVVRTPPDEPLAGETIAARLVTDVNGT